MCGRDRRKPITTGRCSKEQSCFAVTSFMTSGTLKRCDTAPTPMAQPVVLQRKRVRELLARSQSDDDPSDTDSESDAASSQPRTGLRQLSSLPSNLDGPRHLAGEGQAGPYPLSVQRLDRPCVQLPALETTAVLVRQSECMNPA